MKTEYVAAENVVRYSPAIAIADPLGVRPSAVYRAAQRGKAMAARWERLQVGIDSYTIRKQRRLIPVP